MTGFDNSGWAALSQAVSNATAVAAASVDGHKNYRRQWQLNEQLQGYYKENMALQQQYARENFDMVNAYNDPTRVAARYRAAGINPISALGSGSSGSGLAGDIASPSGSASSGGSVSSHMPILGNIVAAADQHEIAQSQVRLNDALVGKAAGETKDPEETLFGQRLANDLASLDLEFQRTVFNTNVDITKETYENLKKRNEKLNSDLLNDTKNRQLTDAQIEEIEERIWYNQQQVAIAWLRANDNNRLTNAQIKKIQQETSNLQKTWQLLDDEHKANADKLRILANEAGISDAEFGRIIETVHYWLDFHLPGVEKKYVTEYRFKDWEEFKRNYIELAGPASRLAALVALRK